MRHLVLRAVTAATALAIAPAFAAGFGSGHSSTATTAPTTRTVPSTAATTTTMAPSQKSAPSAATSTQATTQRGPSKTGQPNQDCETLGNQPGQSISAPGSAFNPNGTSGGVYAGEQPQNSGNTASVSQYDVACARPTH